MWWKFREDFSLIFTRRRERNEYFHPVDGLRAIASLFIISCHLGTIFNTFIPAYPDSQWEEFLKTMAFILSPLMAYGLETFFMLSGFLLTYKLINQWNQNTVDYRLFLQQYPILILKRLVRFWPGLLLSTLVMVICGEPRYPNGSCLLEVFRYLNVWMFFQNYVETEYWLASLAPLWSISLDMQVHMILPVLLYLFYSYKRDISLYYSLGILLILSIILSIIIFDPKTMPIISITRRYHNLPLLLPSHYLSWLETTYNQTFPFVIPHSNPMKLFLEKMYLPLEARFGSFITGSILAIQLITNSSHAIHHGTLKKSILLTLIFLYIVSPILINIDALSPTFDVILNLSIASSRQIFALSQSFILFTALCSSRHSYHSPWIKRFLSLSIWIPISKLSYLVYVIHWRIAFQLIFGGPLLVLRTYSITYAIVISLPIVLFLSQIVSCIWFVLVEKPIERIFSSYLNHWKISKHHTT